VTPTTNTAVTELDNELIEVASTDAVNSTVVHRGPGGRRGDAVERLRGLDYRWVAMSVVLGGTIMTILDATVVNVAIRSLQLAFGATSYSNIAWVVTGYTLAQGAVIPITGWASDRFGTKRLYLITLAMFTVASAACGAAWSLPVLILFRVLQGIGGGMLMPIGMTIILQAFGPQNMGRVMGYFGVPMIVAPALGPVLGGWFVQDFTWRLIFYINVPIGVVAFIAASRLLRESPTERKLRLDVIGLLTATPAVVALMYAMNRSIDLGWSSPAVIGLLALSVLLFAAFIVRELSTDEPLLHLQLFRDPNFSWSIVLGFGVVTVFFGAVFLRPAFLQQVHGYGALATGLVLLPQAAAAAILMPIMGRIADRIGPRPVVLFGLSFALASTLMLAQVNATSGVWIVLVAMGLRGVAMSGAMMTGLSAGLARVPRHLTSRASSITNTAQRVGSSIGVAVLVTVLSLQTGTAAASASCDPSPAVVAAAHASSAQQLCDVIRTQAQSSSSGGGESAVTPTSTGNAQLDAFLMSYRDDAASIAFDRTFYFLAVVAALSMIPALFLRKPPKSEAPDAPAPVALDV
jgi:EmrB/QacA subfamily drug resistance transporter